MFNITLEAARVNAKMTQAEAAKELGVTVQTLLSWEKSRSEPTVSQAIRMARVYQIPFDNLFLTDESNEI